MPSAKVVLNRRGFGAVMASAAMERQLRVHADRVAAIIPGSTVRAVRTGIGSSNSRVRLRVEAEIHERARLVAAIRSVIGSAQPR